MDWTIDNNAESPRMDIIAAKELVKDCPTETTLHRALVYSVYPRRNKDFLEGFDFYSMTPMGRVGWGVIFYPEVETTYYVRDWDLGQKLKALS